MGDTGGVRNSWGWGLPSYREYEIEDEPSRHEAPVFVPQSSYMAGRVPQSPSLGGRRHSMPTVHAPDTPNQKTLQSPAFVSKFLEVKERLSVSVNTCALDLFFFFRMHNL